MKIFFIMLLMVAAGFTAHSQEMQTKENNSQPTNSVYSYAYISVEGKPFSKKLKVEVDLGDQPEQIKVAKELSETLANKKFYAAILNYMSEQKFELVQTQDQNFNYMGSGGTSGIVLIMKKKE
ncbi:hypothetical protein U0035_01910 [Niabella yanshanensis]|uniref:Uncharacterized protein n=1 Tax=Niabella yanshanensis TaxID=577386 RepID=A0ABZ0W6H3_9BACT|nr:hypothetical protein [Niabella yanshanensis]WQD38898.1 hypothetical protein U0035_01910 [Niabella yanshanensis]